MTELVVVTRKNRSNLDQKMSDTTAERDFYKQTVQTYQK